MVSIFIERISNQNYDEHPVWQNILDIERCEREKDGFVTVFPFHRFLFGDNITQMIPPVSLK